jgi:hypothetical protein
LKEKDSSKNAISFVTVPPFLLVIRSIGGIERSRVELKTMNAELEKQVENRTAANRLTSISFARPRRPWAYTGWWSTDPHYRLRNNRRPLNINAEEAEAA